MAFRILSVDECLKRGFEVVKGDKYGHALHETVVAYRAARRSGTASVKTKATVNLSGAKPWRQKGTGRARAGYKSSPVWVGGGVVFGPHPRSYRKIVPRGVRSAALKKAISLRVASGDIVVVDSVEVPSGKTRDFAGVAREVFGGLSGAFVGVSFSESTFLAARNVANVQLVRVGDVNCEDVLRYRRLAFTEDALAYLLNRVNSEISE